MIVVAERASVAGEFAGVTRSTALVPHRTEVAREPGMRIESLVDGHELIARLLEVRGPEFVAGRTALLALEAEVGQVLELRGR